MRGMIKEEAPQRNPKEQTKGTTEGQECRSRRRYCIPPSLCFRKDLVGKKGKGDRENWKGELFERRRIEPSIGQR